MPKRLPWIALGLLCLASPAVAQVTQAALRSPRSTDYLFAADVQDARALWVNPAGLGTYLQASVMGELVVDRLVVPGGDLALAQYTVAFNSRGFSAGYSHDRFNGVDAANSTIRVALARGFGGLAFGASLSFYSADVSQRGLDLGIRYEPAPAFALAAVVRDIGKPILRDSTVHPRGLVAATGYLLQGQATLSGEVIATERPALQTGYDVRYRAGGSLKSGGRLPVGAIVSFDLANNLKVDRWSVGLSIGGADQFIGTTSVLAGGGSSALERLAVTGVATRRAPQ